MNNLIIESRALNKTFADSGHEVSVLKGVNLSVAQKQTIAILGHSGSGKSTLLHSLGGLDKITSGEVLWQGQCISEFSEKQLCKKRNALLGFVYQFHHLLPEFSALENTAMPLLIRGTARDQALVEAENLLAKVGLAARASHKPSQLSGGERQRVAIARALVTKPACVLADEPTGNLDKQTAEQVLDLMLGLKDDLGTSFVIVTHNELLADKLDRQYLLEAGTLLPLSNRKDA